MVPIHDTDIAQERWAKSEWEHYELWEKVESRLRKRRWIWIGASIAVFLLLSSIPVLLDRRPKWTSMSIARRLAERIGDVKRTASTEHEAVRIRFLEEGTLRYRIERATSCADREFATITEGDLAASGVPFALIPPAKGGALGIPGLVSEFCYDYLSGNQSVVRGDSLVGFGIIPVKDLAEGRSDRISILLVKGASGEVTFD